MPGLRCCQPVAQGQPAGGGLVPLARSRSRRARSTLPTAPSGMTRHQNRIFRSILSELSLTHSLRPWIATMPIQATAFASGVHRPTLRQSAAPPVSANSSACTCHVPFQNQISWNRQRCWVSPGCWM